MYFVLLFLLMICFAGNCPNWQCFNEKSWVGKRRLEEEGASQLTDGLILSIEK